MNILFVGPYRQNDAWGQKSRSVLKAIKKTEHTVTSRPVYLSYNNTYNSYHEESEFIIEGHYDVMIQFLLQPYIVYSGNVTKRIGIFNTETIADNIPLAHLTSELLMDEIWTDGFEIKNNLQTVLENYKSNTKVISAPPVLDVESLPVQPKGSIINHDTNLQNKFLFYYIGNVLDDKEGFKETCLSYINTFTNMDPVVLMVGLQTSVDDKNIDKLITSYRNSISQFKPQSQQPLINIIRPQNNSFLTDIERSFIHTDGDCLVCPTYTPSVNLIALEGALYGSTPIVNETNACYEWLGKENLWGIDSYKDVCILKERSPFYRFTSGELWYKPILRSLSETMKNAYINKFKRDQKIMNNNKLRQHFESLSYNDILNGKSNDNSK